MTKASLIAKAAEERNLDGVLNVFALFYDVDQIQKHLSDSYSIVAESGYYEQTKDLFDEEQRADCLFFLRSLIDACKDLGSPEDKKLSVSEIE